MHGYCSWVALIPAQGCASDRAICIHTYIHYACIVIHYNHTYQYTVHPLYDIMFMNKCGYYSFELGARLTAATAAIIQGVASIQINMVIPVIEFLPKDFSVYAILQMVVQLLHLMILERVEILSRQMGIMVLKVSRFCRLITYQPCLLITSNMQRLICWRDFPLPPHWYYP